MTNPTTPFSWQMPTASDLVTDLPADFETFGQAVATSMADLLGGTTGQILSKASNTDMDFTWITNDVGDITAVNAGTGISGGGTSGAVTITNSMATTIAAKGDLIVGTGSGTFVAQTVGANGTVLTANSAQADGVEWATPASGGMTLISRQTLSAAAGVSFTSISATYTDLVLRWGGVYHSSSGNNFVTRINNSSSTIYQAKYLEASGGGSNMNFSTNGTSIAPQFSQDSTTSTFSSNNANGQIIFYNYANTTYAKFWNGSLSSTTSAADPRLILTQGGFNSTSAITSIDIVRTSGSGGLSTVTNGYIELWGVK